MSDIFENTIGLDGFEFVEFAAPDSTLLDTVFKSLGFQPIADHRSKDVTLYANAQRGLGQRRAVAQKEQEGPVCRVWYF